jgi:tetratricopeptide (TPR) repeat protein
MAADPDTSPLHRTVAFTGRLASMKREEAFRLVRQHGGTPRRGVTRKTGVLVVGELGWPLLPDGRPSKSLGLAQSYHVAIVSERQFLEWAGRAVPTDQVKTYSADQVSSLSGLTPDAVEQLSAFGLLDRRNERYGFRDLAAARQLAELLGSGVSMATILKSLNEIRKWLPDAGLANLKLHPLSASSVLIELEKGRADKTGQFMLPVGDTPESADDVFEHAQVAEQANDIATAERLYRRVMRIDPGDPAAAYNLGNLLRSLGRKTEAEAAYRAATKADPRFAEAWYNLADILDDRGQPDKAMACLKRAVAADPDYADAIFNLGLLHQRSEDHEEAAGYWRRYLALDSNSPWAARARKALKYCEMQIARS